MPKNNTRLALNLSLIVLGMTMLAYASVPLYRIFCQVTGYGGTTQIAKQNAPSSVLNRTINVRFNADIAPNLPWEFKPGEQNINVKIGEDRLTYYTAKNKSNKSITGRAVYNVIPHKMGQYFIKIECFCFTNQTLKPGEDVHMPISFYLDPAMDKDPEMQDVHQITLSYTFFPATSE